MSKYFISDTHFGHANIAGKNISKWKSGYRNYSSTEEINQDMVKWINKTVGPDDELYHLGDWSFGGIENIEKFRSQIFCRNIHLILGNHDHHIEENKRTIDVPGTKLYPREFFTSVQHYKEVMIGKTPFVLFHYGQRVWHGSHKGWIHLYGHSHDSLPPYGKSMDVGVDTAIRLFGVPRPFSVEDIYKHMETRKIEFVDHHGPNTNA